MSFNLATPLTETTLATPVCRIGGVTTAQLAAGLRSAGLSPGQVVALQLPNNPQFLTACFGALKAKASRCRRGASTSAGTTLRDG